MAAGGAFDLPRRILRRDHWDVPDSSGERQDAPDPYSVWNISRDRLDTVAAVRRRSDLLVRADVSTVMLYSLFAVVSRQAAEQYFVPPRSSIALSSGIQVPHLAQFTNRPDALLST